MSVCIQKKRKRGPCWIVNEGDLQFFAIQHPIRLCFLHLTLGLTLSHTLSQKQRTMLTLSCTGSSKLLHSRLKYQIWHTWWQCWSWVPVTCSCVTFFLLFLLGILDHSGICYDLHTLLVIRAQIVVLTVQRMKNCGYNYVDEIASN